MSARSGRQLLDTRSTELRSLSDERCKVRGRSERRAGQAESMAGRQVLGSAQPPASSPLGASRRGPYPVHCYLVMAHDEARACRYKGEADAAGLFKSGRLSL